MNVLSENQTRKIDIQPKGSSKKEKAEQKKQKKVGRPTLSAEEKERRRLARREERGIRDQSIARSENLKKAREVRAAMNMLKKQTQSKRVSAKRKDELKKLLNSFKRVVKNDVEEIIEAAPTVEVERAGEFDNDTGLRIEKERLMMKETINQQGGVYGTSDTTLQENTLEQTNFYESSKTRICDVNQSIASKPVVSQEEVYTNVFSKELPKLHHEVTPHNNFGNEFRGLNPVQHTRPVSYYQHSFEF